MLFLKLKDTDLSLHKVWSTEIKNQIKNMKFGAFLVTFFNNWPKKHLVIQWL